MTIVVVTLGLSATGFYCGTRLRVVFPAGLRWQCHYYLQRVAGPQATGIRSTVNRLPAVPLSSPPFLPCLPEIDYHFHVNGNYSPAREAVWRNANFLLLTDLVSTAGVSSRLLPRFYIVHEIYPIIDFHSILVFFSSVVFYTLRT